MVALRKTRRKIILENACGHHPVSYEDGEKGRSASCEFAACDKQLTKENNFGKHKNRRLETQNVNENFLRNTIVQIRQYLYSARLGTRQSNLQNLTFHDWVISTIGLFSRLGHFQALMSKALFSECPYSDAKRLKTRQMGRSRIGHSGLQNSNELSNTPETK